MKGRARSRASSRSALRGHSTAQQEQVGKKRRVRGERVQRMDADPDAAMAEEVGGGTRAQPAAADAAAAFCSPANDRWLRDAAAAGWTVAEMARGLRLRPAAVVARLSHLFRVGQLNPAAAAPQLASVLKKLGLTGRDKRGAAYRGRPAPSSLAAGAAARRLYQKHGGKHSGCGRGGGAGGTSFVGKQPAAGKLAAAVPPCHVRHGADLAVAASPDLTKCTSAELLTVLKEAGTDTSPLLSLSREELLAHASLNLPTWEVRRLLACKGLPPPSRHHVALRLHRPAASGASAAVRCVTPAPEQVRVAYRRLCLTVHPDKNPCTAAAEAFQVLRAACDALLQ